MNATLEPIPTMTPAQKAAATRAANREARNREIALAIAQAWHRNVSPLHSADVATTDYGLGPHDAESWDRYSKGWHRAHGPSRWKNSGVTRDPQTGLVTLCPVRGRRIELDTPRSLLSPKTRLVPGDSLALLDGDVYGVIQPDGSVLRYGLKGPTGVAIPISENLREAWKRHTLPGGNWYIPAWEHGDTVEDCRRELSRKLRLARERVRQARLSVEERAAQDRRRQRRIHLVLLLCPNAVATVDQARAAGYCRAGIEAFQRRHGLGEVVPLSTLVATGNHLAGNLARRVAAEGRRAAK